MERHWKLFLSMLQMKKGKNNLLFIEGIEGQKPDLELLAMAERLNCPCDRIVFSAKELNDKLKKLGSII